MLDKLQKLEHALVWTAYKICRLLDFISSFLEMHLVKIVSFSIMALCCSMVNALHMIVVVMMLMCLLFGLSALRFSFSFIGPYLSVLFLSKMAYQTKLIPDLTNNVNCSDGNNSLHNTIANTILDPLWWGFEELKLNETLVSHYKGYLIVFIIMTLQTVIRTRQKIARIDIGASPDIPHVLYMKTTRLDADRNLKECLKYLINYGFYKFGVEITLSFCIFLIGFRMDVFSVLYGLWVIILFFPSRPTLSLLWPFFFTTLLFSILWQYSMAVGLSEKTCFEYPWAHQDTLIIWMFLPSFHLKPDTKKTLVDFVLLLLIQRQQSVFELEKRYGDKYLGGSNKEIYRDFYNPNLVNPTPNHTLGIRSWIDVTKFIFMTCFFRITLAFLFWNGASNVNILSLGYLVGAFVFLWIDYDLCLWHIEKILRWWNSLLGYTVGVIILKTLLEFVGCLYGDYLEEQMYWLVGLARINCTSSKPSSEQETSFLWDIVCFVFIIFQRRHFKSYYFLHEIEDALGVHRLQEKGARLMDEVQELKLKEFQDQERKTLMQIKKNVKRIKAWQKRMHGLNYVEPTDHATATYMGDYFMFENLDKVSAKADASSSSDEDSKQKKKKFGGKLTMSEFIENVFLKAGDEGTSQKKKAEQAVQPDVPKRRTLQKEVHPRESQKDSKGKVDKSFTDESEDDKKAKKGRLRVFMDNIMLIFIRFFNKYSKDYRYIQLMMKKERKKQKGRSTTEDLTAQTVSPSVRKDDVDEEEDEEDYDYTGHRSSHKLLVKLLTALVMFIMSKTELLCYMMIFFHTISSPTLIGLPLPMLVFLWGSLTAVRPTTTFWTVLIAYAEVTIVIKALFQNSIFPWNKVAKKSSSHFENPPLFLGIHKDSQYVLADLFLLVFLFLHRYKLKTLGLWNRTREEETFLPQDLRVYKILSSEKDLKDPKRGRSLLMRRKTTSEPVVSKSSTGFFKLAIWKCTSRATAKFTYRAGKIKTKILVKEIEGKVLVTHDGRRLQPTDTNISQISEDHLDGNVVLRVYFNDIIADSRYLGQKLSWVQHFTGLRKFFLQIVVRDWRVSADYYTLMFIFEFLNFLIIFFGYSSFANLFQPSDVQSEDYFSLIENQMPPMYLFTIITHFLVIIIDRVFYLRKNIVGKLVLHITLVLLVHLWMFFLMPVVTESSFNYLLTPQMYYVFSCFYFLMSAYQLRVGYPMRVQGHFLSKKYGYINYYAYKGLQFLPFFNQFRTLLDFLCTNSSLTMMEWIKMESIFQLVFENKCSRRADIYYPSPRGEECPKYSKYCPGVFSILSLFIVIWLPFLIFALSNTVAQANLPQEASLELSIGNFGEMYTAVATFNDVIGYSDNQYKSLMSIFKSIKHLWTFLSMYDSRDVGVLRFRYEPYRLWTITPKELSMLNKTIQNLDVPVSIYLTWIIKRSPQSQIVATATGHREIVIERNNPAREELADAFLYKGSPVHLNSILPKFIHVTNDGKAKPIPGFLDSALESYRNMALTLVKEDQYQWWKLEEIHKSAGEDRLSRVPLESTTEITIFTFNEKSIPKVLLNVRKKGIFGLYLSMVFVTWTFVRRLMWKYPQIKYDDMPNPDPVLQLCQDIYLARESQEFALEEDLYAKLLFLFRSPETMIKVTRLNT